ncbi:hypothetical protein [Amycolatopsis anabasis]|uniref:hypothetical protein n=1 Tax=Amycolatopsis anabasis TaxID=1840409 RepID=UPI00131DA652|nr:hypothetical protein [Amycolatopsis anabasis]
MTVNTVTKRIAVGFAIAAFGAAGYLVGNAATSTAAPAQAPTPPKIVKGNDVGTNELSFAKCPDGTALIGGGYASDGVQSGPVIGGKSYDAYIKANAPSLSRPNTWAAKIDVPGGTIAAYAVCATG